MGQTVRAAFVGAGAFASAALYPRLPLLEDFELAARREARGWRCR